MSYTMKQKADAAWENVARSDVRAAVDASIGAALSPVLERVARLENPPRARCSSIVRGIDGRACPDCSKPAASTEAPPHIEVIRNDLANNPDRKLSISDLRTYIAWLESRHSPAPAATDFRGTIAPGTTISVDVGPGQNISPAESEGSGGKTSGTPEPCPMRGCLETAPRRT